MNGWYTILLLIGSNIFMTFAWYGHLKLQQEHVSDNWPLIGVIAFSWAIAFIEYCMLVPANRIGFEGKRRPVQSCPAEGHSGSDFADYLCRHSKHALPGAAAPLEPYRCVCLSGGGSIFCVYEIKKGSDYKSTPFYLVFT